MNVNSARDLGAFVRSERKERGWSQKQLAARADVSAIWLSQLERGKPTAQFGLILRILKELGHRIKTVSAPEPITSEINLDAIIESHTRPSDP